MATISQSPFSLFFPSFHYRNPLVYSRLSYLNSTKKNGFVCFACSIKQIRVRKRVKSNEELRSEIMEFVALTGFPEGHVPSMKELSEHGRVDLANIVRRRGYKFIKELLANSDMEDCNELVSEDNTNMERNASGICLEDSLTGQDEEALDIVNSSPDAEENASVCEDESLMAGVSSMELDSRADIENSSSEASISANRSLVLDDTSSCSDREADNVLVTEDKEINDVEEDLSLTYDHYTSPDLSHSYDHYTSPDLSHSYDHYTTPDLSYTNHVSAFTSENTLVNAENFQNQKIDDMAEIRSASADDSLAESDDKNQMLGLSSSTSSIEEKTNRFIQNGYLDTVGDSDDEKDTPSESCPEETKESAETTKGGEYIGDSHGAQRSVRMAPNGSAVALEEITYATEVDSSNRNSDQRDENADLDKDSHDETMRRENQVEITRLRFMLRQKELELSRLKEQIEKEKLSLSVLQRKAETEIEKAQMLISEKGVELQEAEESLSGLQEVEIQYCGDGNVVEVTGSFNGWEHRVGLELQASKSTGKQKCWSTLLWLYPGTYELKFIVDGQWTTDSKRDSVTRGHITNNILKVER
ncbi:hypothetical protein AALP_AA8G026300 [Arabis alpina]|uniref:AMP-activated protein kinase glycogen-binding domain-containing protein n=1 Tax=Arabis alpina TaxID=50452 RepID=A0A087G4J5_ARAAL|nr:hypothetical protein AALP_AA8G026300 [Arabis alpina]